MDVNFKKLRQGVCPDIDGASSTWTFDKQTHASVIGSTFRRWRLYDGCFLTTEYVSTDGGGRTSSSKAMWEWTASTIKTFEAVIIIPRLMPIKTKLLPYYEMKKSI